MSKRAATPVRFDPPVAERLASFVAANPGMSLSSAANRLVDEAMRMAEHPGVIFRSGPTGRRAALAGGPDVWEVIRAVKSAHTTEPGLDSEIYRPPSTPEWDEAWRVTEALMLRMRAEVEAKGAKFLLVTGSAGTEKRPVGGAVRNRLSGRMRSGAPTGRVTAW